MNRVVVILCCTALAGGLFWFFPLFHIERINTATSDKAAQATNTRDFAAAFWAEKVIPALGKAPEGEELISALRDNPEAARKRFGHKVGVSRTTLFIVQGKGKVVAINKSGVGIAFREESDKPDILLHKGILFGNTVRDSTGLIVAGNFPDSRKFNEVSTELNGIVETEVTPRLENASIGNHIQFVGCVEIPDQGEVANPLSIIPLRVGFE